MEDMEPVLRYRGREIRTADVITIRELIAEHPKMSRRALSLALCEAWNWKQENGAPRDASPQSAFAIIAYLLSRGQESVFK